MVEVYLTKYSTARGSEWDTVYDFTIEYRNIVIYMCFIRRIL